MQLCCIRLRHLRYLRENIHMRELNLYCTNETQMTPADSADDAEKQQNHINLTKLSFSADSKQTFMHKKNISVRKLIVVSNFVMFFKKDVYTCSLYPL